MALLLPAYTTAGYTSLYYIIEIWSVKFL